MSTRANLVQVEFFHVGGNELTSFKGFEAEVSERIAEEFELVRHGVEAPSSLKTVVRFFDETGVLTRLALQAELLSRSNEAVSKELQSAGVIRKILLIQQLQRNVAYTVALRRKIRLAAIAQLQDALNSLREIAVERVDRSFRELQRDEVYELQEAALVAKSVWIFVFEPNTLLADKNTVIASVI